METLIIHPKNKEQLAAIKAFVKALKIDFTTKKSTYNPEFVAKIKRSEAQMKEGKGVKIAIEDLWK
ncbi:DUF2683 family protein [Pedobacter sp. UBA4863]|uniref:DUF2683 family protein n=1 Tax=Pedobacter sp. UBA4863 TaxID=1947060 RepID=UPI0025DFED3A|nr:DUF2683 family protein [Pedobacter sp. UBA4863]